jgi:hypothetical protein
MLDGAWAVPFGDAEAAALPAVHFAIPAAPGDFFPLDSPAGTVYRILGLVSVERVVVLQSVNAGAESLIPRRKNLGKPGTMPVKTPSIRI